MSASPELAGRRGGKTTSTIAAIREALARGEHIHLASTRGLLCVDGPDGCTAEHCTLGQAERKLRERR